MILIDAIYINNGGGKVLLDYLINELEKIDYNFTYLLDKRIFGNHPQIKETNKIIYLESSLIKRHFFYKKNRFFFTKVFCFGNVPPTFFINCETICYFHNYNYLKVPNEFSIYEKVKHFLKIKTILHFSKNISIWFVQSSFIKRELQDKIKCHPDKIITLPFYFEFNESSISKIIRNSNNYLYVSSGLPHKNHLRLINAFCVFYDKHKRGKLILTIDDSYFSLLNLIKEKQDEGYPIVNKIFSDRISLQKVYLASNYFIFPSVSESFGLGIIEAIQNGCKIIGADLPYMYEICSPSLVFDPLSEESILNAFEKSINISTNISSAKIKNNINDLIKLIVN